MSQELAGLVLLQGGLEPAALRFGSTISSVERLDRLDTASADRVILPGFIDVHVHGGGGGDTMDGVEGIRTLARFHLRHGTTTILPTTITNPLPQVLAALHGVRQVRDEAAADLPDIHGAHLEGPFISRDRLGAQPDFVLPPSPGLLDEILALDIVRVVTLAPELPGAAAAARQFQEASIRVSLGHSTDDGQAALRLLRELDGPFGFTHLFNAMGGIEGRRPGLAGVALAHPDAFAELIFDLQHVHPLTMRAALAAKPDNLLFVTDSMRAAGLGDGPTELGGQSVTVTAGRALLQDGTLAGSVLTMDQALRNALDNGLTWNQAASLTSGAAARYLGLSDRGQLVPGQRADLVVLDSSLKLAEVWLAGRRVA